MSIQLELWQALLQNRNKFGISKFKIKRIQQVDHCCIIVLFETILNDDSVVFILASKPCFTGACDSPGLGCNNYTNTRQY